MESVQKKVQTVREMMKGMKVFITCMLVAGPILGLISAFGYRWIVTTYGHWDVSKDTFHMGILLYGLGFTFPILSISVRLMTKMFFQNCEQIENQNFIIEAVKTAQEKAPPLIDKIQSVVDKAVPIANNIEEIVGKAKTMSSDVEAIAHKVRTTMDSLNGSIDVKVLEGHFKEVKESLKVIAGAFTGPAAGLPSPEIELVPGGGRRRK